MEVKFISKTKLSKQGQITLPLEARKDLDIDSETELYWYKVGSKLVIVKELVNQKDLIDDMRKDIK